MGYFPAAGSAVYSASKAFVNYFTEAIAYELKDRIDVQCLTPGSTTTNLVGEKSKTLKLSLTAEKVVLGSLRDLGSETITGGAFRHDLLVQFSGITDKIPFLDRATMLFFSSFRKPSTLKKD